MVGATAGTEGTAGTGVAEIENTAVGGSGGTKPLPQGGLAQQLGRGPEDRGTWEQRFGLENQYNRPGVHQGVAYKDEDGILKADHVPANMQNTLQYGMMPGDAAPAVIQGAYDMYQAVPKTLDLVQQTLGAFNPLNWNEDNPFTNFTNYQQEQKQKKADEAQAIQDALQIQTTPNEQDDIMRNAFERQQLEKDKLAQDQLTADENQIFADQQLASSLATQQAADERLALDDFRAPKPKKKQEGPKKAKDGPKFGGKFGKGNKTGSGGGYGHHSGGHHW
jgi:hypothetical protein